ncbi:hypothetical protein IW492_17895 [Enterococcus sp. BWB1-3]|uniref:hypothetical protein n=1 Tax=Enterococcus sp. BWB1-3 TaxID=2787713 RepID=UPI001920DEA0|nr:hypothetical protein [Enterococcus sp. BWB1-3]MBL1231080.1 hypothetical protein [Enterococcus sp. BWB1-3]
MKIKCLCGNVLNDENLETTNPLIIFSENEYYDVLESNPKTVEELVDNMPLGSMWECRVCGRLFYFKEGKFDIYSLEKEVFDSN